MSESASVTILGITAEKDHAVKSQETLGPLEVPAGSDPLVGYMSQIFAARLA